METKVTGPSGRLVDLIPVDFEQTAEPWSTVELIDGTILKAKIVFAGVSRLDGEYDAVGNPVYAINQQMIVRVVKAGKGLRGDPTFGPTPKAVKTDSVGAGYI